MVVTVIGLGVIGASFAMALKNAGYKEVYGIDVNTETIDKAEKLGIIKKGFTNGDEILKESDLVILSIYPDAVEKFISDNFNNFKDSSIITDVTGVKCAIIDKVRQVLPKNVDFVFGHPMAGREKQGIDYATNTVFNNANYIITPIKENRKENIELLEELVLKLGFRRVAKISPEEHDLIISFTSQLPHAIAVALINSDKLECDTGCFIGDSYRDLTRIANINEVLWSELFFYNKENLLSMIDSFLDEMNKIKICIENNDEENLKDIFIESSKRRIKLEK